MAHDAEYYRRWRRRNPEKQREKSRRYRDKNKAEQAARNKRWRQLNPAKVTALVARRRIRRQMAQRLLREMGLRGVHHPLTFFASIGFRV